MSSIRPQEGRQSIATEFPLTKSQLLLWAGQEMNPTSPLYNMILTFDIQGKLDISRFQAAFQEALSQSESLRTVFVMEKGFPKQKIVENFSYSIEVLDISADDYDAWLAERKLHVFDLATGAFDSVLIRFAEDRFIWYLNPHHVIMDIWAISVFYQRVGEIYSSRSTSNSQALFQQYASKEPEYAALSEGKYWETITTSPPSIPRLYGQTHASANSYAKRIAIDLGAARTEQIRKLALTKGIRSLTQHLSFYNIFAATLYAFLYRVSGQDDINIGTIVHNRNELAYRNAQGMFMEVLPLRNAIQPEDSFMSLVERTQTAFHDFLRQVKPGIASPELSRNFNIILNYINTTFPDFGEFPVTAEWIHPDHSDPGHHMRLHIHDYNQTGNIQLFLDLNSTIFDEELRELVPQHFLALLDAFIADPTQSILGTSLISEKEQTALVDDFNQTELRITHSDALFLFTEQVSKTPGATALVFQERLISYSELDTASNQLAHFLIKKGLKARNRVGLYMTRTPEFITAIFAIWKAQATYVPIPSGTPSSRIEYLLKDADTAFLLTQKKLQDHISASIESAIYLDEKEEAIAKESTEAIDNVSLSGSLAYIMYTSGSTGQPKGVMIGHDALANYLQWARQEYQGDTPLDFPLFTMIGFDLTVTSQFLPLVSGGKVVIYEESLTGPDLSIIDVLSDNAVNAIKLTPAHLALVKDEDLMDSNIRTMLVGGEAFKGDLARRIDNATQGKIAIYNEYGPTEATVGCVLHRFDPTQPPQAAVPIGKPGGNMQAFVLDAQLNPVPKGVIGELYIGGKGLAKGYLNRPQLTQDKFIVNPFEKGKKMYRTGDLVRLNTEGELEYLGRKDHQVKLGGIRIELGEIEAILANHPAIQEAVLDIQEPKTIHTEDSLTYCVQCGLPSNYPEAEYDEKGVCNLCNSFETYQQKTATYFKSMDDLERLFEEVTSARSGEYDCLMLLSGGKDSSYALGKLVEMGLKVLSFTLDNGYISEQAKENIRRVVTALGVDHIFGDTESMNAIFVDSLQRHSNVCNGCFKTLYTLSTQLALNKKIPYIITGLSRGQFFETRLTEELFWEDEVDVSKIDQTILEARKAYHRVDDAVCQLMDVSMFADDQVFQKVKFLDFYRFTDVSLEDMLIYLDQRLPWTRPTDTGRSTNCLINQVGIYVHKKEQGYNNYSFPYSWDVRIGHKTRDEALDEINEEIDEEEVQKIMREIGYPIAALEAKAQPQLIAHYVSSETISSEEIKGYLREHLPAYMIPARSIELEEIPLTSNGKVDRTALRELSQTAQSEKVAYVAPESEVEEMVTPIWEKVFKLPQIGMNDDFIALGGNSLTAIRLMARINETFGLELPLVSVFEQPTIAELSMLIEDTIMELMEGE